jgi:hypothetical protein
MGQLKLSQSCSRASSASEAATSRSPLRSVVVEQRHHAALSRRQAAGAPPVTAQKAVRGHIYPQRAQVAEE